MSRFDSFLDRLADFVDEREAFKRNGGKLRFAGSEQRNTRYYGRAGGERRSGADDELGDLTRYEGMYKEQPPERKAPLNRHPSFYTEAEKRRGYEFTEVRGSSSRPGLRREYDEEDDAGETNGSENWAETGGYIGASRRPRSTRIYRPPVREGHVFDDIEDEESGAYYEERYREYRRAKSAKVKPRRVGNKLAVVLIVTGALLAQVIIFASLRGRTETPPVPPVEIAEESVSSENATTSGGDAVPLTKDQLLQQEAKRRVESMTVEEKAGQLLLLRSNGASTSAFAEQISACHAGGVVLFTADIKGKNADEVRSMIGTLQNAGGGSLLVCVDEEGGTVVRVSSNTYLRDKKFRSPQNIYAHGGMEAIRSDALEKSRFLLDLGINVNLAPVVDVVTNSKGYMFDRAFGKDAPETAEYARTVVEAMKEENIGCCVKHFPGYGNTEGNTHNGLVVLDTAETVVYERDLLPFKAAIEAGTDAVLVSHTIVTSLDNSRPASLSDAVIAILRGDLGFEGVIISDGLDMDAITEYAGGEDVCVAAVAAGIDLLCTPKNPVESWTALCNAVRDGTLTEHELTEAAERVVLWKLRLGVISAEG